MCTTSARKSNGIRRGQGNENEKTRQRRGAAIEAFFDLAGPRVQRLQPLSGGLHWLVQGGGPQKGEGAVIEFTVFGTPRPQGSMRAFMKPGMRFPVVTSDNRALRPWRQEITASALALKVLPFEKDIPIEITLNFYFTRPKSASKRKGMTVRPDGDKLIRACLDSIKGVLIHDDAQVVEFHARKHYGGPERCEIRIQEAV